MSDVEVGTYRIRKMAAGLPRYIIHQSFDRYGRDVPSWKYIKWCWTLRGARRHVNKLLACERVQYEEMIHE
jgi:hypothetical protein